MKMLSCHLAGLTEKNHEKLKVRRIAAFRSYMVYEQTKVTFPLSLIDAFYSTKNTF
jgi:hypothetical protein